MTIFKGEVPKEAQLDVDTIGSDPIIIGGTFNRLTELESFCPERLGISLGQLEQTLLEGFAEAFVQPLPEEYISLIVVKPSVFAVSETEDLEGLSIKIEVFTKKDFVRFVEQYRAYKASCEGHPRSFLRMKADNVPYAINAYKGGERAFQPLPMYGEFGFQVFPYWIEGLARVHSFISHLEDTGRLKEYIETPPTPLRYRERGALGLPLHDYAKQFLTFRHKIAHLLVPDSGILFSAGTLTEEGIAFNRKKGGYLSKVEFMLDHPGLLKMCPLTEIKGRPNYSYLLVK